MVEPEIAIAILKRICNGLKIFNLYVNQVLENRLDELNTLERDIDKLKS